MQFWKKLSQRETETHSKALNENVNFAKDTRWDIQHLN
jgi:hypothetical protein